jgi:hypothetical protein
MSAQEEQPRVTVKPTPIPYLDKENTTLNHDAPLSGSKTPNPVDTKLAGSKRSALSEASGGQKPAKKKEAPTEVDPATISNLNIGAKDASVSTIVCRPTNEKFQLTLLFLATRRTTQSWTRLLMQS